MSSYESVLALIDECESPAALRVLTQELLWWARTSNLSPDMARAVLDVIKVSASFDLEIPSFGRDLSLALVKAEVNFFNDHADEETKEAFWAMATTALSNPGSAADLGRIMDILRAQLDGEAAQA